LREFNTDRSPPNAKQAAVCGFDKFPVRSGALAASAGGVEGLGKVLSGIPGDFPAAVLVVQHRTAEEPFQLPQVLSRRSMLLVERAREGVALSPATVLLAPPARHLLVKANGTLSLSHSAKVHHVRPSADRLFESVATRFKQRAIAVVLTGASSDGHKGVQIIKKRGGVVIAQEPTTADFPGIPRSAIATGAVDFVVPLDQIASTLISLVRRGEPSVASSLLPPARPEHRFQQKQDYYGCFCLDGVAQASGHVEPPSGPGINRCVRP
jgi:two-component system chemotaxis response regulator CheB